MPPKRKTLAPFLSESPSKRVKGSSNNVIQETSTRTLRSHAGFGDTTSLSSTPRRNLRTYGKQAHSCRSGQSDGSTNPNEKEIKVKMIDQINSEDELDVLSPIPGRGYNSSPDSPPSVASSPTPPNRSMRQCSSLGRSPKLKRIAKTAPSPPSPTEKQKENPSETSIKRLKKNSNAYALRSHTLFDKEHILDVTEEATQLVKNHLLNPNIDRRRYKDIKTIETISTPSKKNKRGAEDIANKRCNEQNIIYEARTIEASTGGVVDSTPSSPSPPIADSPAQGCTRLANNISEGAPVINHTSQSKKGTATLYPSELSSRALPQHLHHCLNAQKRAILRALNNVSNAAGADNDDCDNDQRSSTNSAALKQLTNLLNGTTTRGEGNSCLILGPKGSGKSRLVDQCLSQLSGEAPFVIRLSGWAQHNDRLAMREIAYQLSKLTGTSFVAQVGDSLHSAELDGDNDVNPFLDVATPSKVSLPPSSHLPALISVLPTLQRPTIIILDGFDLFALHPRQFLLYCLLDTVQSCSMSSGVNGLAVIGLSSRFDTISMLEKRVKSRFSGRMIRTAPPRTTQTWKSIVRTILSSSIEDFVGDQPNDTIVEWQTLWTELVNSFLNDQTIQTIWDETFGVARDIRMLSKVLLCVALRLSPSAPTLSPADLIYAATAQRARPRFPSSHALSYPCVCLLIASVHANTAGHSAFTFEMLHEYFRDQVRTSTSAPVQVNGGSIGMLKCSRQVLMTAFEILISINAFVPAAAYVPSAAKGFVSYRSSIDKDEVRKAVDRTGQTNLRKWFSKNT